MNQVMTPTSEMPNTPLVPPMNSEPEAPQHQPHAHKSLPKIFVIVALAVVAAALIAATAAKSRNNPPTPLPTSPVVSNIIRLAGVSIKDGAFLPATLQVRIKTQVTWTNNERAKHQVAADPYPLNNSIPGFNSNVILQKGDSYSFIFSTAGTYTYHDQLNPLKIRGTIIVK